MEKERLNCTSKVLKDRVDVEVFVVCIRRVFNFLYMFVLVPILSLSLSPPKYIGG